MDVGQYYVTTLTNAFTKLAPVALFIVAGWFIFIKLPFLMFRNQVKEQKKNWEEELKTPALQDRQPAPKQGPPSKPAPQLKLAQEPKRPESKKERPKKEEARREERKERQKREAPPKPPAVDAAPEIVFNFRPGEAFTKEELRKRYHELLRQNHPDRVASMGNDFKKLAEKNTKEINKAYDKLKSRAS
jgi:hypothetical protein